MVPPQADGWRAMASHGLADLSPPEALHAMLELPTDRAAYVGMLQDMGGYPQRSPIGTRVPDRAEVAALVRLGGRRWRAVVLLDDERALRTAAVLFRSVYVLDPYYDCGAQLYAAWHDPAIKDEHARQLAEQARCLVAAGSLLEDGTAVLAPDCLPGSWNPRPGWRRPRAAADKSQLAGWAMRSSLVLLYWADRLGGVVCASRGDVVAGLDVALGHRADAAAVEVAEPRRVDEAQTARMALRTTFEPRWAALQRASRGRTRYGLDAVADGLSGLAEWAADSGAARTAWRLTLGERSVPDSALLIRRVLNGQDPERSPRLPTRRLSRRPLALVPASF